MLEIRPSHFASFFDLRGQLSPLREVRATDGVGSFGFTISQPELTDRIAAWRSLAHPAEIGLEIVIRATRGQEASQVVSINTSESGLDASSILLTLQDGISHSIRILDDRHVPIPTASVESEWSAQTHIFSIRSDADTSGRVLLGPVGAAAEPAQIMVFDRMREFVPHRLDVVSAADIPETLLLERGHRITGRFRTSDSVDVTTLAIAFYPNRGDGLFALDLDEVAPAADGHFLLTGLPRCGGDLVVLNPAGSVVCGPVHVEFVDRLSPVDLGELQVVDGG